MKRQWVKNLLVKTIQLKYIKEINIILNIPKTKTNKRTNIVMKSLSQFTSTGIIWNNT